MSLPGRGLFARPIVRLACAVVATAVLGLTVWVAGARAVLVGLGSSVHALPVLAALEAVMLACSTLALRALYAEVAALPSPRQWVQAGAAGYAVGLVLPMGRSSAEATRAVLLGRSVGGARAAVAAVQMQGVTLVSNALFVVPATIAALVLLGPGTTAALVLANGLVAGLLGLGILVLRQRARPGRWLGRLPSGSSASAWRSTRPPVPRGGPCCAPWPGSAWPAVPRPSSAGSPWQPLAIPRGWPGCWSPEGC